MSEYQYYEFLAIDRPLSQADMTALRRITSRAEITATRLSNVYNFGNFRGNPRELMRKYFDAMVYLTNWGTRQLMLKLPSGAVDPEEIAPYCVDQALEMEVGEGYVLLDFKHQEEGGDWIDDRESEGFMPSLAPLRSELLRGERVALYLAWLHGASMECYPEEDDEDIIEPPVPPGLSTLSASCRAFCEFFGIDEDLIAAAAEGSEKKVTPEEFSASLRTWLRKVPAADKDDWILRLATGTGAGVEGEVLRLFREERPRPSARGTARKPRTAAEILARADVLEKERRARKANAAARTRTARARAEAKALEERLKTLAQDEAAAWRKVDDHIASKSADRYDQAVSMLLDLRALAERSGKAEAFDAQLRALRERHATKQAFIRRLRENVLGAAR
jgi:hypothetical protein